VYARAMAERSLNVVLLARRQEKLDAVAAAIRADTGVETRAVAVDLAESDAMDRIEGHGRPGDRYGDGRGGVGGAARPGRGCPVAGARTHWHARAAPAPDQPWQSRQPDDITPIPGAATSMGVVAMALTSLADGPTCFATEELRETALQLGRMTRSDAAGTGPYRVCD
jgi:hypothetical protein